MFSTLPALHGVKIAFELLQSIWGRVTLVLQPEHINPCSPLKHQKDTLAKYVNDLILRMDAAIPVYLISVG